MSRKRTEKNNREGMSLMELVDMFPDEAAARKWFEGQRWSGGIYCPHCGSDSVAVIKNERPMPYRCRDCREHFSVRTGMIMSKSRLPLRKWLFGIYLLSTNLKGVSSMKIHRDLGMTQKSAWLLMQKIRQAFADNGGKLSGEVEIDETYIGGLERNKHADKKIKAGRGTIGKAAVMGMVERGGKMKAMHITRTDSKTMKGLIGRNVQYGSQVYTDEHLSYKGLDRSYRHGVVKHSAREYVNGMAHTNGIESFWALFKRGLPGTYHHVSVKHLDRYAGEFAGRHNSRAKATLEQMTEIAKGLIGKRLTYKELTK